MDQKNNCDDLSELLFSSFLVILNQLWITSSKGFDLTDLNSEVVSWKLVLLRWTFSQRLS